MQSTGMGQLEEPCYVNQNQEFLIVEKVVLHRLSVH